MRNVQNVTSVKPEDFPGLVSFAKEHEVNLVVPGPEAPLVAGIEGFFRAGVTYAVVKRFCVTESREQLEYDVSGLAKLLRIWRVPKSFPRNS